MPSISNLSFSVRFNLTGAPTLELTDQTVSPPTGMEVYFDITQPDAYTRVATPGTPDTTSGGTFSSALRLASDGSVQQGQYTIVMTAVAPGYLPTVFSRTFQFAYEPVALDLREEFDVFTPSLKYFDDTVYSVSNFSNGAVSRSWSGVSTPTGTITSSGSLLDLQFGGQYYDANYTISLASTITYTHTVYSWLTVQETISKSVSTYAETPPTADTIVSDLKAMKSEIDRRVDQVIDLWTVKNDFIYSRALFEHIIDRIKVGDVDGIYRDLKDLIASLHNYQIPTYVPTNLPIGAFDLTGFFNTATWGSITGTITSQIDLINYIAAQISSRTGLIKYTSVGLSGDSFTVDGLAGKTVLAAYRGNPYKRPVAISGGSYPTDFDTVGVIGTDLGSNQGIVSTSGVVRLVSGDSLVHDEKLDFLVIL